MKGIISVIIIAKTLQSCILYVESYNLTCPSEAHWKFRATAYCNSTLTYFCLYNNVDSIYVEGCVGPDWDRKGSKRIFAGFFTRGNCTQERFQPIKFWTNESMSDCIYTKSICSEMGQIVNDGDSSKKDRTCRCDYKKNYSFTKTPRNLCFCIPTEEDCSCYIKSCPLNFTLSADYKCTQNSSIGNPNCEDLNKYNESVDDKTGVLVNFGTCSSEPCKTSNVKLRNASIILICLCSLCTCVACGFFVAVLYQKRIKRNLELLKRTIWKWRKCLDDVGDANETIDRLDKVDGQEDESCKRTSDIGIKQVEAEVHQRTEPAIRKIHEDEVKFLRMIHLLFRVACPVIRMIFNSEIEPSILRKKLDQNKDSLRKKILNKSLIDQDQWNLLFPRSKGSTCANVVLDSVKVVAKTKETASAITNDRTNNEFSEIAVVSKQNNGTMQDGQATVKKNEQKPSEDGRIVSSDGFDIGLMLYLLRSLSNIEFGDYYPVQSDTKDSAMLARIKYTMETIHNFKGKFSDPFDQYWDDIGQAVLSLVSSYLNNIDIFEERKPLIGRLLSLNPIDLDKHKVCRYIVMSEKCPAKIIQKIISEYCWIKQKQIEDILADEKHELYHKRIKTDSCCVCDRDEIPFSTYAKIISEKQWKAMYEIKQGSDIHLCPSKIKECSESFIPKQIDTCDLSVTLTLVLNAPDILKHIINRTCKNGFNKFLKDNKHTIYHSMEKKRCCQCVKAPTEKILIKKKEWEKLFKKEDAIICHSVVTDCCCQYSVESGINISNMDDTFLSKILHVAGPLSVLYKLKLDTFLYFSNWTDNKEDDLNGALTALLNMIEDAKFRQDMFKQISSNNNRLPDAHDWVSKHLRNQKATTDQPIKIIAFNKDGFDVKTVQIPKEFTLPDRTRHFKDLTGEEHNFLVIVHALTTVIYPVIKDQFNTQCPDAELKKIRQQIYDQQTTRDSNMLRNDENKSRKKKIYLTEKQKHKLFKPGEKESRNLDLKLMIYILRIKTEEDGNKDYVDQLDIIDNIRREIVFNCSGVLNDKRFKEIQQLIRKAVVHFGEEVYKEQILNLRFIRNIIELL